MDQAAFQALAQEMGVTQDRLLGIQKSPSLAEAQSRLAAFKDDVKANYRKLAFKYHPDRNPNNAESEAKFRSLAVILKEVEELRLQAPRPMPQTRAIVVQYHYTGDPSGARVTSFSNAYAAANHTATGNKYDARKVVFIRVG